jgi:hypothetical protein
MKTCESNKIIWTVKSDNILQCLICPHLKRELTDSANALNKIKLDKLLFIQLQYVRTK